MNDTASASVSPFVSVGAAPGRNMPDAFLEIRRSLQAREILVALEEHGGANDAVFYAWLGKIGLGPSHCDLSELLDRLERDGLIVTEQVSDRRVIRPTRDGIEVAQARTQVDWVARIDPK